jgi:putative transcriptional regulator
MRPGSHTKDTQEMLRENYETILLGYAAGLLDMAQNMAIAAHLSLSPAAREFVRACEAVGGCLIETECAPISMKNQSIQNILARLYDAPSKNTAQQKQNAPRAIPIPADINMPEDALDTVTCRPCRPPSWKKIMRGLEYYELPLECRRSHAQFIKAKPAAKMPHHGHRGVEITLVLDGGYSDEFGNYHRGDLIVMDSDMDHAANACREYGAVTLVVSSAPVRLNGFARLLNPFLRF